MGRRTCACLLWAFALGATLTAQTTAAEPALPIPKTEETWQVIYLAGQRVGYARIFVQPIEVSGETLVRTETESHLTIKRFGQTLRMSTGLQSDETPAGDLRRFVFKMSNPPASSSSTTGVIEGNRLRLTSEVDGKRTVSNAEWKPGVKSPSYQDRWLRQNPLKAGEKAALEAFFPEMGKPGTLSITGGPRETAELLDGKTAELQRMTVGNSLVPGITTSVWINSQGDSIKTSTSMLGTELVSYTVPKDEALKSLSVAELDLGVSTLVKTRQIQNPYATKKMTYTLTLADGDPARDIPTSPTQTLTKVSDHVATLVVTPLAIPEPAMIGKVEPEFLESSQYLQVDDPLVQQHATAAAGQRTDPGAVARAMERYVHEKLTKKNFSTALASAGEVARTLEGDCTEHAVLLAAMLRVKKIPARVAVGLVYVEGPSAFGGHMWTEAYLNETWIPLDATLARGGTTGVHIKLGDASLGDANGAPLATFTSLMNIIGKLKIQVDAVE